MNPVLKLSHNWGFFSCCSIKLHDLIAYIKHNNCLPSTIDYSELFSRYNSTNNSIHHLFFDENLSDVDKINISAIHSLDFTIQSIKIDPQFSNYKNLQFNLLNPLIKKYFTPSDNIFYIIEYLKNKYPFNNRICSVIYRGNDKSTETTISPYNVFIDKAKEVLQINPDIVFHVQTDETEFKESFLSEFAKNSFYCDEVSTISHSMTSVIDTLPIEDRINAASNLLSLVYIASQSNIIITHSGNVGLWTVLFRGHADNIYQVLNNQWL